jgi:uncharacterized protein
VSSLRKRLRDPGTYLLAFALLGVVVLADAKRAPAQQTSSHAYVALARFYQHQISPQLTGWIRCRFRPTCSEYSIEAVQRFGIIKGLRLTANRLWRCRGSAPPGTPDPVP